MRLLITRRAAVVAPVVAALVVSRSIARPMPVDAGDRIADLERRNGGRLGVAVLDTANGRRLEHRADERFAMCSTFKFLAAAHVLSRVDHGEERLDRRIRYGVRDLVTYSPVTKGHVADGMTLAELCEAAVTVSDNTAGNLLLASFGGPAGLTGYARALGDKVTRLDRVEPELNEALPGDPCDTTTPAAMLENLRRIVLGDALSKSSRDQLTAWLIANKTGDKRLRAGLPKDWRVGDKTGASLNGIANDIAVVWPPGRAATIVTAYFAGPPLSDDQRNGVLSDVGSIVSTLV